MTCVLVVGVAVADYLFFVDEFPRCADKYRAHDAVVVGGGCGANAAVAISRLHGAAMLSARLGHDAVGDMILEGLRRDGVNVDLCDRSGTRSSYSSVLVNTDGERQIVNFRGAGLTETADHLAAAPTVAAVLADTRWSVGAKAAMELAAQRGVPGVLDIEAPAEPDAFTPASHLAFSMQGLAHFYPDAAPVEAIAAVQNRFGGWVCVTLGADGVLYHGAGGAGHIAGYPVDAVDTLGAGDVWHGAFALALGEGQSELEAVRFANAVAAIKCTRPGGREGSPTREETEQFMKERS